MAPACRHTMLFARVGLILGVIAALSNVATGPATAGVTDVFLCYDAGPASAPRGDGLYPAFTPVGAVTVIDGFSSDREHDRHMVDLRSGESLCSPAVIGGRGAVGA